ncbi:MAG: hypothetical protein R3C61_15600 [Bacteroidia bacterium]
MINVEKIKEIHNAIINRLFLIVFPPLGEDTISEVDIRLGLVLKRNPEVLFTIGTDMNDVWSPLINEEPLPLFSFNEFDFEERVRLWMKQKLNDEIALEYYDFTNSDNFNEIVGKKIEKVELIMVEGNPDPFGIKILFEYDFIISFPNSGWQYNRD